jgi:hypothetical protein
MHVHTIQKICVQSEYTYGIKYWKYVCYINFKLTIVNICGMPNLSLNQIFKKSNQSIKYAYYHSAYYISLLFIWLSFIVNKSSTTSLVSVLSWIQLWLINLYFLRKCKIFVFHFTVKKKPVNNFSIIINLHM